MLSIAKRIFLPIAFACLAYFAWHSRVLLVDILQSAKPVSLATAVLLWMTMNALAGIFAIRIFRARNVSMPLRAAIRVHIGNLPARYLPGGIWHTVGRIASFRELGIGKRDISVFVFLENFLGVCVAFIIGGSLVAAFRGFDGWGVFATIAAAVSAILLIALPFLLSTRVLKNGEKFPTREFAVLTMITAITWCVASTAFVIYLAAFPALSLQAAPLEIAGSYLFSWGVGYVSIFAPQGIGVFEVVAADLLHGVDRFMSVAALLAGFRLVILAADLIAWTALQACFGRRGVNQQTDN